jgi:3-methyladenine DNA glycosylase Mpg
LRFQSQEWEIRLLTSKKISVSQINLTEVATSRIQVSENASKIKRFVAKKEEL